MGHSVETAVISVIQPNRHTSLLKNKLNLWYLLIQTNLITQMKSVLTNEIQPSCPVQSHYAGRCGLGIRVYAYTLYTSKATAISFVACFRGSFSGACVIVFTSMCSTVFSLHTVRLVVVGNAIVQQCTDNLNERTVLESSAFHRHLYTTAAITATVQIFCQRKKTFIPEH